MYKKSQIVLIEFGSLLKDVGYDDYLNRNDLASLYGIKLNKEFAYLHMGLILSPTFLNYTPLVIPITSLTSKYEEKLKNDKMNLFLLKRSENPFLLNDSVLLLDKITHIDNNRIKKEIGFLRKRIYKEVTHKLHNLITP